MAENAGVATETEGSPRPHHCSPGGGAPMLCARSRHTPGRGLAGAEGVPREHEPAVPQQRGPAGQRPAARRLRLRLRRPQRTAVQLWGGGGGGQA